MKELTIKEAKDLATMYRKVLRPELAELMIDKIFKEVY